ncbi:DNA polymerase III subunit alpha [Buchnera aphidicola]|uniref:DNA polymerase III subunit alpha n=1 Tax=Buchnera aphidicola TaxID=9 RepID=UPI0025429910|nr:DNA polymerase III subunit alpha [Buchnera aphidicola]WII23838.1 DNA polymerase III subunit alpha [Buchnera aphidicola (Sipha maydis)]
MLNPEFIHLRVHSDHSILDGLSKPEKIVQKAIFFNMPAIGITDFTNLYGIIKFYKFAHKNGIKPIIGSDFNILSEDGFLDELTILAYNNFGYENLKLLISRAYKRNYIDLKDIYIKKKWLVEYRNGLIILSGGIDGSIGRFILNEKKQFLEDDLNFFKKYFNNFYYLEISRFGRVDEEIYIERILDISIKKKIPVVATNNVRFLQRKDFYSHIIRVSIHHGVSVNYAKKFFFKYNKNQFFKSIDQMKKLFQDIPESLFHSVEISKRCNVHISFQRYFLPKFFTGTMSSENFLIQKSHQGLKKRIKNNFLFQKKYFFKKKLYRERLKRELNIINKMGFSGYFLVVMEFIKWAKRKKIPVGPGRGSGAGSLVAYVLEITEIDPLNFDLLFERFLNLERISMPDFDIDFCMNKRDLVINHVSDFYGRDFVSQIITFGTMTAKAVIRDVGRALGYPYGFLNRISKMVPLDPGITLKKAISVSSELNALYKNDIEVKELIDSTVKLEGVIRNVGKHAGGVVISPTKITNFTPLYYDNLDKTHSVTQFDKNDIEDIGLVKFDFLGLKTLTIIDNTVKMIDQIFFKKFQKNFSLEDISLDDKKSFNMLKKAETTAVFQLESYGIKDLILRLRPDSFDEIVALVALFRPGPLQSGMVDNFINRKYGKEKIYYPDKKWQHKLLKPILKSTYGIILYQEQVMKIAQILANYTLGEADLLRYVMGKKNFKKMSTHRKKFILGAKKNNISEKLSNKIFNLLEKFAGYGFNKSHSVAYALISYQTLWLKSNFSAEFMASAMTMDMKYSNKIMILINEAKRMKLKISLPNINLSQNNFFVNQKKEIVFGLGAIKGIGENTIDKILFERNKNGLFSDIFDLCFRVGVKVITKKILEKLIFSGACSCFNKNRLILYSSISHVMKSSLQSCNFLLSKQLDFFLKKNNKNLLQNKKKFIFNPAWSYKVELDHEKDVLGFYLSKNPFIYYLNEVKNYINLILLKDILHITANKVVNVAGMISNIRFFLTKNKNKIAIINLDDSTKNIEIIVFSQLLLTAKKHLKKNNLVIINGFMKKNLHKDTSSLIANKIDNLYAVRKKMLLEIKVILKKSTDIIKEIKFLKKYLVPFLGGKTILSILFSTSNKKIIKKWKVYPTDNLFYFLYSLPTLENLEKIFFKKLLF